MKKSSPKKRILKNREVDELKLGSFCLIDIDGSFNVETEQKKPFENTDDAGSVDISLEKELKRAYDKGFDLGRREGFEKGKEEGFKVGYEKGYEEGRIKGLEEGRREGFLEGKREGRNTILKRYNELIDSFNKLLSDLDAVKSKWRQDLYNSQDKIVDLVLLVLRKLIVAIPEKDKVKAVVEACLDKVVDMENVKLKINPKDWELIEEQVQLSPSVKLELDETLKRGDCVIETESGSVETKLEERVKELISLLTEGNA